MSPLDYRSPDSDAEKRSGQVLGAIVEILIAIVFLWVTAMAAASGAALDFMREHGRDWLGLSLLCLYLATGVALIIHAIRRLAQSTR